MTINAIAVDDEPKALEVVKAHAAKVPFLDLKASFTNAFEVISYLNRQKIDLIFLDIKMPDISGIDFLGCLQNPPVVIFTTAYSEYAIQGFELDALDYLLKPFSLVRFTKACNKALEILMLRNQGRQNFIFVKTGYEEEKVLLEDILYIEAEGNYVSFVLKEKKLLSRLSMADASLILPADQFIRIHRSFIISIDKIEKLAKQDLVIAGKSLPFGVSYETKIDEIRIKLKG